MKKKRAQKPPQAPPNTPDRTPADIQPCITHVLVSIIELHVNLSSDTPTTRFRMGFGAPESRPSWSLDETSQMIALATIWLPGALNGGDYAVLQNLFFPVREKLQEYFCGGMWPIRYQKELWKNTRANDVRTWCRVIETYYGGLMDREALSDPPVHLLPETDDALLGYLFSRVYDWFEGELRLAEGARLDEQPDAVNRLLEIWNGSAEGPALKLFLPPYMSGNPITRYLSQREEMFRARSARICERMANLLRKRDPQEAQLIEGVLKAFNDRQAKKKSS